MANFRNHWLATTLLFVLLIRLSPLAVAHVPSPIAIGPTGTQPGLERTVRWTATGPGEGYWAFENSDVPQYLMTDPAAAPMVKLFSLPRDYRRIGGLQQGWTAPVSEYFFVSEGSGPLGGDIPRGRPITQWSAQILNAGWEWVVSSPGTPGTPLITVDGLPVDWEHTDLEPRDWNHEDWELTSEHAWLSVRFSAIETGASFVIRKQLRWIGTPDNTVWGDGRLDDGSSNFERGIIRVIEYPTVVPEPATFALALTATFCLVRRRR